MTLQSPRSPFGPEPASRFKTTRRIASILSSKLVVVRVRSGFSRHHIHSRIFRTKPFVCSRLMSELWLQTLTITLLDSPFLRRYSRPVPAVMGSLLTPSSSSSRPSPPPERSLPPTRLVPPLRVLSPRFHAIWSYIHSTYPSRHTLETIDRVR